MIHLLKPSINDSDNNVITTSYATGDVGYSPLSGAFAGSLVVTSLQSDLSSYDSTAFLLLVCGHFSTEEREKDADLTIRG